MFTCGEPGLGIAWKGRCNGRRPHNVRLEAPEHTQRSLSFAGPLGEELVKEGAHVRVALRGELAGVLRVHAVFQ